MHDFLRFFHFNNSFFKQNVPHIYINCYFLLKRKSVLNEKGYQNYLSMIFKKSENKDAKKTDLKKKENLNVSYIRCNNYSI